MGSDLLKSEEVTLQNGCESKLARGQSTKGRLLREVNSFSFVREEFTLLPTLMYEPKAGSLMTDGSTFALHLM